MNNLLTKYIALMVETNGSAMLTMANRFSSGVEFTESELEELRDIENSLKQAK